MFKIALKSNMCVQELAGKNLILLSKKVFPGGSDGKASAYNAGDLGLTPWVGKIPWRRAWEPTPVSLPGKSHGQRNLVGKT